MSRSTPWGAAQITENHFRGFSTVHTAGHGGMMVSRGAALKYLSSAARKRALMHNNNNYFCYEEDCDALLVLFDAKELRKQLMSGMSFFDNKSDKEIEQYLVTHLTAYHSDYLLELGVSPDPFEFEKVLLRKAYIENIENKSPTTVVACRGDSTTLIPGLVIAITADDKTHYVSEASYDAMMTNSTLVITRPLNSLQPLSEPTINISDRVVNYILVKAKPYFDQVTNDHPNAIKEKEGKFYGPISRFSYLLNGTIEFVMQDLTEKSGMTTKAANHVLVDKLDEIRNFIDPRFHQASVFCEYLD